MNGFVLRIVAMLAFALPLTSRAALATPDQMAAVDDASASQAPSPPDTDLAATTLAATTPEGVPPASNPTGALDDLLTVVIGSGCAHGRTELETAMKSVADLEVLRTAQDVLRICQQVQVTNTKLAPPFDQSANGQPTKLDRSGRGKLAIGATAFGLWAGIAIDIIFDVDEARAMAIAPLLGMGAGLTLSLLATQDGPITSGEAWTIITGLDYGTYSGLLLAGALKVDSGQRLTGVALFSGLLGGGVGIAAAHKWSPSAGDAEVVRSGGLWGFATGGLLAAIIQRGSPQGAFAMMLVGMDGGLLTGILLTRSLDVSRNRMLLIDAGTLAGTAIGFGGTLIALGAPDSRNQGRVMAGMTLLGLYAGMAATIYLTRSMDGEDDQRPREQAMALVHRGHDGAWQAGRLLLLPSFSETAAGLRPTGAWMPLVGGHF